jgi:hypothetical protein
MATDVERALYGALKDLEQAVAGLRAGGSRPDMAGLLARVDELAGRLPPTADTRLRHYLERRSYEKARQHLASCGCGAGGE